MLNRERLVELYRELRDDQVLSIYANGEENDPAERHSWRRELDTQLSRVREGASGEERERIDRAAKLLFRELERYASFLHGKGWVGYATPEKVWYAEEVPVPMPTMVRWEPGLRAAPYVRALKQERSVTGVLVDQRRARIFAYRKGALEEIETRIAEGIVGDLSDVNVSPRAGNSSGGGGETATDAGSRAVEIRRDRMLREVSDRLVELCGDGGFLLVGGSSESRAALLHLLPKGLRERTGEISSLPMESSLPEVKRVVEAEATQLTQRYQAAVVGEVLEAAGPDGRGVLGDAPVESALAERRVDRLILTRNFIRKDPERADYFVGRAFEQGADLKEISGGGAERLDREGEGIGARLRW